MRGGQQIRPVLGSCRRPGLRLTGSEPAAGCAVIGGSVGAKSVRIPTTMTRVTWSMGEPTSGNVDHHGCG
jgi:hypothetical protein